MGSIKEIFKNKLVKLVSKFYDPLLDYQVGNQSIKLPLSHRLPETQAIYPDYNFNIARLSKYVAGKYPDLCVIDIGANIGDTVAYIKNYVDPPILCIDGDEKYLDILRQNVAKYKNVSICHTLVGAETKEMNYELKKERGTAYLQESKEKNKISTIEDILKKFPDFKKSKLLKIDTDGFDSIILRTCRQFLSTVQPVLFFEFDPFLIAQNNDDPFTLLPYLKNCGYQHLVFFMNNGDYLLSCDIDDKALTDQLIQYFSGRNVELFVDICAFPGADKDIFDTCVREELKHFKEVRKF